jgi:hypothetical protein
VVFRSVKTARHGIAQQCVKGAHAPNYAQWESREAMDAMLAHPASQQHLRDAAALARFEPYLYEVTSVFHR